MRIFVSPPVIADDEGFDPKRDIFRRKEIGDGLTNLISSVNDPLVIAIDAQWGSGKSTFLRMWAGELRKADIPVIMFDAFENDYVSDAFISIASEIIAFSQTALTSDTPKLQQFIEKTVKAGSIIARSALKIGVKIGTLGAIDASDIENIEKYASEIANETAAITDKHIGEILTKAREEKETLQKFREALSSLAPKLSNETDRNNNLVIIIDELDRCRPDFALQILERMKHFFAVPGVHFVLGAHMKQLYCSVEATYGFGIDSHTYLHKFINMVVSLPLSNINKYDSDIDRYIEYLSAEHQFDNKDNQLVKTANSMFSHAAKYNNMSLRTIERIYSQFALSIAVSSDRQLRIAPILAGLCIIKIVNPSIYDRARSGDLRYDDVRVILGFHVAATDNAEQWWSEWWRFCTDPENSPENKNKYQSAIWDYNLSHEREIVPLIVKSIIDRLRPFD